MGKLLSLQKLWGKVLARFYYSPISVLITEEAQRSWSPTEKAEVKALLSAFKFASTCHFTQFSFIYMKKQFCDGSIIPFGFWLLWAKIWRKIRKTSVSNQTFKQFPPFILILHPGFRIRPISEHYCFFFNHRIMLRFCLCKYLAAAFFNFANSLRFRCGGRVFFYFMFLLCKLRQRREFKGA